MTIFAPVGDPNRGKKPWNCWWKSDLYHYFGIYPTTTHNMYTFWCDSLSLSVPSPAGFSLNHDFLQLFHRPGERPSSMVAAMRPGRGGENRNGGVFGSWNGDCFTGFMPWGTWNEQTTLGPQGFQTFGDFGTPPRRVVGCWSVDHASSLNIQVDLGNFGWTNFHDCGDAILQRSSPGY